MKLATLKSGSRDGQLVVVSRDLNSCVTADGIAPSLQYALDQWDRTRPQLEQLYEQLNHGTQAGAMPFDQEAAHSPLPRAYQFLDGSAYLNHVELVRRARGATVPASFYDDPLMYQGGSDSFIGPRDVIHAAEPWGIDFEGEVAVITGDVPLGADLATCEKNIRLVLVMNDVSLRELLRHEITKELGFVQSKPASAFSPVAVTPDELGSGWQDYKLTLPVRVSLNGKPFGHPNAGQDMQFNFARLVQHAAVTRQLAAGSIIGGGTVSNKQAGLWGSSIANGGVGYCCIAELRMYEMIEQGKATSAFMRDGDVVRIEVLDAAGKSIFGAIENTVRALPASHS